MSLVQLQAQQLYCGSNAISFPVSGGTCSSPLGIGAENTGNTLLGWTYGLYIEHNTSSGGGLFVTNPSTATGAFGIYTMSTNGNGLISWSNAGNAVNAVSVSGDALLAESTSGNAIHAIAASTGLAGLFDGDVEVNGNQEISGNLQSGALSAEVSTTANLSAASFEAGTNRQLFVVPNLGNGGFNFLSQTGDHGIFFSDGLGTGNQNQSAGLVIGPWKGAHTGIRINSDGKVGIGVALPQQALDVEGEGLISSQLSVPKVIGEQNSNTQFQLCANTDTDDGGVINLFGNGSSTRPGHISLTAGNGNGVNGGEVRFMQNLGSGNFVQNMVVTAQGEVGIGIDDPTATLHVVGSFKVMDLSGDNQFEIKDNGFVTCRQVDVNNFLIPDYVFKSDYPLMPLNQLEKYIRICLNQFRHNLAKMILMNMS